MKRILYTLCIGTIALAVSAMGEETHKTGGGAKTAKPSRAAAVRGSASKGTGTIRSVSRSTNAPRTRTYRSSSVPHAVTYRSNTGAGFNRNTVTVNRANRANNFSVNRQHNFVRNRNRNIVVTNNWRSARFNSPRYSAFRNYQRQWHDQGWWRSHYSNIVFVNGGWYYWNTGYWYPAWGYDPYASYVYDGPIYACNNVSPDRVVVDVQNQLHRDGYYAGPVDGQLGPMTRQAIAAFQTDHGLAVTSAIDQPTLSTLGLV